MTKNQHVFKVDDETIKTDKDQLTVREILQLAGDTPPDEYYLVLVHGNNKTEYKDLDQVLDIKNGLHFLAVHRGPMTTS